MNTRTTRPSRAITRAVLSFIIFVFLPTAFSFADPILKPKKYRGPIPKRYFTLSFGFLGGADNEEMYDFLEGKLIKPEKETDRSDFGSALVIDGTYTVKMHPQFAMRVKSGVGFLGSSSRGFFVAEDTLLLNFDREFDVFLFSIEGSAIYYFADASKDDFQPYFGGGFSFDVPRARYTETLIDADTNQPYGESETIKWSGEAGIHTFFGMLYHVKNTLAVVLESRFQIAQSKFPLQTTTPLGLQTVSFDVDYSGFILSLGVAHFF
jgi:hypothetical protein